MIIKHGATGIHDMQRSITIPTPIGENAPHECDLHPHQELVVWDEVEMAWVSPDDLTPITKAYLRRKLMDEIDADFEQAKQHREEAEAWEGSGWEKFRAMIEGLEDE